MIGLDKVQTDQLPTLSCALIKCGSIRNASGSGCDKYDACKGNAGRGTQLSAWLMGKLGFGGPKTGAGAGAGGFGGADLSGKIST